MYGEAHSANAHHRADVVSENEGRVPREDQPDGPRRQQQSECGRKSEIHGLRFRWERHVPFCSVECLHVLLDEVEEPYSSENAEDIWQRANMSKA